MKRILILCAAVLLGSLSAKAQESNPLDAYESINFYGIDFTTAQVYGASESGLEFKNAFLGINGLLVTEYDKYVAVLQKKLKKTIAYTDVDYINGYITDELDTEDIKTARSVKPLTTDDVADELMNLEIEPADGLGLIVMAGELNKITDYGTFYYVFFDNRTFKVVDCWAYKGATGGMELRNYWAKSFYNTILEITPSKIYGAAKKVKGAFTGNK